MSRSQIVANRIAECKACSSLNKLSVCKECGCFMPAKVRLMGSECPRGKWKSVFGNVFEEELDNKNTED